MHYKLEMKTSRILEKELQNRLKEYSKNDISNSNTKSRNSKILKGLIIDRFQAHELVRILGVELKN